MTNYPQPLKAAPGIGKTVLGVFFLSSHKGFYVKNAIKELLRTLQNELNNNNWEFESSRVASALMCGTVRENPGICVTLDNGKAFVLEAYADHVEPQWLRVEGPSDRESVAIFIEGMAGAVRRGEISGFKWSWSYGTNMVHTTHVVRPGSVAPISAQISIKGTDKD